MTTKADPIARGLAEYIASLKYEDLPAATVAAAKEAILDQFGIILMGSTLPWTRPSYELAMELGSKPQSTIAGHGDKVCSPDAAMVNSNYAHSCEFDDTGYSGGTHASSITVASALALAEARQLSGRDFLLAVVLGCQVLYKIGRVLTRPISELGFHAQALVGPFGSATVTAKLLDLDVDTITHALSITGSHSSGTMEYDQGGGEVKRYHSGMAARAGMIAALLAQNGLTGPPEIFEGKRGLGKLHARLDDVSGILEEDSPEWFALEKRIVKAYPTVGTIPPAIQAFSYLIREHNVAFDELERIDVWINPHALGHGAAITKPKDTIGAQFSLAFSLGLAMVKGSNELKYYVDPEVLSDPEVLAVGDKLHVHGDMKYGRATEVVDWDLYWGSRTQITLADGRTFLREELYRKGAPQNPLTHEELVGKFRSLASAAISEAQMDKVVAMVDNLENVDNVADIAALLHT